MSSMQKYQTNTSPNRDSINKMGLSGRFSGER